MFSGRKIAAKAPENCLPRFCVQIRVQFLSAKAKNRFAQSVRFSAFQLPEPVAAVKEKPGILECQGFLVWCAGRRETRTQRLVLRYCQRRFKIVGKRRRNLIVFRRWVDFDPSTAGLLGLFSLSGPPNRQVSPFSINLHRIVVRVKPLNVQVKSVRSQSPLFMASTALPSMVSFSQTT